MNPKVVVLKFGSSVLRSEEDLPRAVHEIYRWWRRGSKVIAVASAFGDTTDRLMLQAKNIGGTLDTPMSANLLATGEAESSALLGLSLNRFGIPACVLDPSQAGLRTVGARLDSSLVSLDSRRLSYEARNGVVVLPGFVGRDEVGGTTLLGRGGSDYSALFVAHQLKARCILLKNVDGLYTSDPSQNGDSAPRFAEASYESAIRLGRSLVQEKAIRFAAANNFQFTIARIGMKTATDVGPFSDRLDTDCSDSQPLRVVLLGCGTVGGGVYEALRQLPELFSIVGVGVRTGERATQLGVPLSSLTADLEALIEQPADVVVELIGGTTRAASLTRRALQLRRHVVTANKSVIALEGDRLRALAQAKSVALRYSAAVGGVMPAIETIQRMRSSGSLRGFSGVLNATANFVLDQLVAGQNLADAVKAAQARGYAEANPRQDLEGIDAAHKLAILARIAFDVSLPLDKIACQGISGLKAADLYAANSKGKTIRLIASCRRVADQIEASVEPAQLSLDHPLAQVSGTQNRLLVEPEVGDPVIVSGEGAGRWPTTEAVISDLLDLRAN